MINGHALRFFFKETFNGLKRSNLMTVIAVITVSVTLIILGAFMLISANLSTATQRIASKLEVRLFLKPNLLMEDIQQFRTKLRQIPGVKDVVFVDRQVAWDQFRDDYDHLNLSDYITDNPLPHSLNIVLNETRDIQSIVLYIKRFDTVIDDIVYGGQLADRVELFRKFVFLLGWGLIVLLVVACLFIIVNTIRLTVMVRDEEIGIMQLVGATNRFIKGPFLIEGFVIGLFGSLVAVSVLYGLYALVIRRLVQMMPFFPFISHHASVYYVYVFVMIIGSVIGTLGAYISVSKSLK